MGFVHILVFSVQDMG